MLFESVLLLPLLVVSAVVALNFGFKPWQGLTYWGLGKAIAVAAYPAFFFFNSLLQGGRSYMYTLNSTEHLMATLPALAGAVDLMWRHSLLIACIVPGLVFCFLLLSRPSKTALAAVSALGVLTITGLLFVYASTLFVWLVSFELLLLVSLYLLRLTSKSERIGEAVTEMFFWTLAGSICLLVGSVLTMLGAPVSLTAIKQEGGLSTLVGILFLIGFGVKLPVWPCFSWLLKAHVEASVEFSILLSGLVVKFGALGLYRTLLLQTSPVCGYLLVGCSTIAIIEASLRLLGQRDLKRIVALTTVIELNWVGVCIGLGGGTFDRIGALVLVAHSFTTAAEFYSVECLYRRYGTRDLVLVSGVAYSTPFFFSFLFLTTLTTIGFPGTSLFIAKLLFLSSLAQLSIPLCFIYSIFFVLILPIAFIRVWVPVWFGQCTRPAATPDLSSREVCIFVITALGSISLGLAPALAFYA